MNAEYFRRWRAAHPEYRKRQSTLRAERRRRFGRESRAAEYAHRKSRAMPPCPAPDHGHPLFERARAAIGPIRSTLTTLYDPLPDDLLSEAVLALIEGRDAAAAVAEFRRRELRWGRITAPLRGEWAA